MDTKSDHEAEFELSFISAGELLTSWARQLSEGGFDVEAPHLETGQSVDVTISAGSREFRHNPAEVIASSDGRALLEVQPGPGLSAFFEARRRREAPESDEASGEAPTRAHRLEVDASTPALLADLWELGLHSGHLFIQTDTPPPLRAFATVALTAPGGVVIELDAEVLHRVLSGPRVGIGMQLTGHARAGLAQLEAMLRAPRRPQRVLVIDDEPVWRTTWKRLLKPHGIEVLEADDGKVGLELLIDRFFEIDLVVLDLHMPHLDGRALIDRVRRLGGESSLQIFLVSGAGRDELTALVGPAGANGALSKLDSIAVLERTVLAALEAHAGDAPSLAA
ncbi:MAG: response regulator [Myxococcaceae bacterium]